MTANRSCKKNNSRSGSPYSHPQMAPGNQDVKSLAAADPKDKADSADPKNKGDSTPKSDAKAVDRLWYCCFCPNHYSITQCSGPYNCDLYKRCITCEHDICENCEIEEHDICEKCKIEEHDICEKCKIEEHDVPEVVSS